MHTQHIHTHIKKSITYEIPNQTKRQKTELGKEMQTTWTSNQNQFN